MPGTFIVKPIEANLTYNSNFIHKMNPYCSFIVDGSRVKGPICHRGGKHPHWNDVVTFPDTDEPMIPVEIMDKDKLSHDDNIGSFTLDLQEVQRKGHVNKWYPLYYKDRQAGNILLETVFQPGKDHHINTSTHHETIFTSRPEPVIIKEEHVVIEQDKVAHSHNKVFTEQKQIIEPHTFVKEVEVVENRPAVKEIEVMEPVKVVKDVQVTEAVPVKKHIKVTEPEIVTKEVEVMEPRLVTKTIQVVEDVPVKKEIEVVEMKNTVQEVETVEPQTVTEQIEVTEYVPVKKAVEVTQPVTVKKAVEFVEPVITTNTVTKEVKEPVVIGEKITKTVGPARVTDASQVTDDYREKIYAAADLLNDIDMSVDVKTEPFHHRQEEIISTKQYKEEIEVKNEEKRV